MLIIRLSLAAIAVTALVMRPRAWSSAIVVGAAAIISLALGAPAALALTMVGPLIGFLTAALTLASLITRTGLTDRVAGRLARLSHGRSVRLYLLVCTLCVALTEVVSLDGAVVLMVPLVLCLHRRYGAPLAPNLFGVVAVANTSSIALPQGNPTNLVLISHLHLSPAQFTANMIGPGLAAAGLCAIIVWFAERRQLSGRHTVPPPNDSSLTGEQRSAGTALAIAALAAWLAPFVGLQPWWPFIAVVASAVLVSRDFVSVAVPWRIATQIAGLVIVVEALGVTAPSITGPSLPALLGVALGTGAIAAVVNNLPASVWASTLLTAGPLAYGATIGLAVGALAAPQGSVATLIAADLVGDQAPPMSARQLAPLAIAATIISTLALRLVL